MKSLALQLAQIELDCYERVFLSVGGQPVNTGLDCSLAWVVLALGSDAILGNLEGGLFGKFYFIEENG